MTTSSKLTVATIVLAVFVSMALYSLAYEYSNDLVIFLSLNLAIGVYSAIEIRRRMNEHRELWMIDPIIAGTFFTVLLGYVISNVIFFIPRDIALSMGIPTQITPAINKHLLLVLVGCVSLWAGHRSFLARSILASSWRFKFFDETLRTEYQLRTFILLFLVSIVLIARLAMISLGVYGYNSDITRLYELSNITQYLAIADSLGSVILMVLALTYYSKSDSKPFFLIYLFFSFFAFEIFFGFMSGFKARVVFPFAVIGVSHYAQTGKWPKWLIPSILLSITVAYAVIEPFRALRNLDKSFQNTDFFSIMDSVFSSKTRGLVDYTFSWLQILGRVNLTYIGSIGIDFIDFGPLPDGSPAFLNDILLAPFHALIPRFLWESKSFANIGNWYYRVVLGGSTNTAVAMGPFAHLYFAGGIIAVCLGFFLVGIVYRLMRGRFCSSGSGGMLLFLGIFGSLIVVDSSFNSYIIGMIRSFIVLYSVQYFVYKK